MERVYFLINEKMAGHARSMWSFSEYKPGSTTEEYKSYVNEAYNLADEVAAKDEKAGVRAYAVAERDKDENPVGQQHPQDYECDEDGGVVEVAPCTGDDRKHVAIRDHVGADTQNVSGFRGRCVEHSHPGASCETCGIGGLFVK